MDRERRWPACPPSLSPRAGLCRGLGVALLLFFSLSAPAAHRLLLLLWACGRSFVLCSPSREAESERPSAAAAFFGARVPRIFGWPNQLFFGACQRGYYTQMAEACNFRGTRTRRCAAGSFNEWTERGWFGCLETVGMSEFSICSSWE